MDTEPRLDELLRGFLGLLGIPLVLGLAWLCLGRRPSLLAVAGALLIVAGTAISGLRVVLDPASLGSQQATVEAAVSDAMGKQG